MTENLAAPFPGLLPRPQHKAALGWIASAAAVAVALSGLAALAMSIVPPGDSAGDGAVTVLLLPSTQAIAALAEPAPDAMATAPAMPAEPDAPADLPTPDLPATDQPAPERPVPARTLAAPEPEDAAPRADTPPPGRPADLAEDRTEAEAKDSSTTAEPENAAETPKTEKPKASKSAAASDASSAASAAPRASADASIGAGQKAVASYGAAVMKKIRQTKKRRAPASGTVVVRFVISDSGGISSLSVAKSSGSAALDEVALDHIARAAPFPAPPPGAGRSFAFEFQGR